MQPNSDADNQPIIAAVQIGEAVSFKAFNACTKNGHTTIAVVPKALAAMASGIRQGDFWQAHFTPYDLCSARLISPLPARPDDWPTS
jgi:translation initiation factor IF-1